MARGPRAGEVWVVDHTRKGRFTAKILVIEGGPRDSEWVRLEIVAGRARMMSDDGDVGPRDVLECRRSFMTFVERIS